jgi:Copper binding periplasmic protein CusF
MQIPKTLMVTIACFAASASIAQNTGQGQIVAVNEREGTISVRSNEGKTDSYRLKDGLLFNALKLGDTIRFTTQPENGQLVISNVERQ